MSEDINTTHENTDNTSVEPLKTTTTRIRKPKSKINKPTEPVVQAMRNPIRLRSVKKSYIQNRRFELKHDLGKVVYILKNGKEIVTTFAEQLQEQLEHDLQTYFKQEDEECFSLQHSTTLFSQKDLDVVMLYDTEGKVIFAQEYGGVSF